MGGGRCPVVQFGDGVQQQLGVGVGWPGEERVGWGDFTHLPQVHNHHPVADPFDHRQVVCDEEQGQAVPLLHVLQQVEDLGLYRHVERGYWLIAQQHAGLQDECAGDADPLALSAGEFVRSSVTDHVWVEPDRVEHLVHSFPGGRADGVAPDAHPLGDDVADCAPWVEGGDRVLKYHLKVGPDAPEVIATQACQLLAVEVDRATSRWWQLEDGSPSGRFSAPGFPYQADRLSGSGIQADAGDGVDTPSTTSGELDHQIVYSQHHVVGVA